VRIIEQYPLRWPTGWPRTRYHRHGNFLQYGRSIFLAGAIEKLGRELRLLDARNVVLSLNEVDGIRDPGVAIYFALAKRQMVMACDRYVSQADNARSLGLAIAAMRQLERHGGGAMMNRAFDGFAALPSPDAPPRSWREVLGISDDMRIDTETIDHCYRIRAKRAHPDAGGSHEAMAELNAARGRAPAGRQAQRQGRRSLHRGGSHQRHVALLLWRDARGGGVAQDRGLWIATAAGQIWRVFCVAAGVRSG